jgi:PAS domain S-box-containing protein
MNNENSPSLDALAALVFAARPDGRIAFLNMRWTEYTGIEADGLRGRGWHRVVHRADLPDVLERWPASTASRGPAEIEARLRRADGEHRWFLFRLVPVTPGNHDEWCGIAIDVEKRRQAEHRARERESRFRMIIDGFPAIVSLRTPSGDLEHVNHQFIEYAGTDLEALQSRPWHSTWHPDDREAANASWRASLASGSPWLFEGRRHRKDGVYRWFQTRGLPLRDAEGRIVLWYLLHTDIDDRRRAEAMLAGEKQMLELVARGRPLPEVLDALCRHFEANTAGCLCSVVLVNAERTAVDRSVAPSLPDALAASLLALPFTPEACPCFATISTGAPTISADFGAETRWKAWREAATSHGLQSCWSTPIVSSTGKTLGSFAVYRAEPGAPGADLVGMIDQFTHLASIAVERERSEEALAKARTDLAYMARVTSLGVITASIAHEVNQPLAGIITNASACLRMLAADPANIEGARETARRTIRDANRAADVIARLRALFSKSDGRLEPVDLNEATSEVLALSQRELQQQRISVRTDLASGLPAVRGDRVQLQQVVLNLVLNAVDAMRGVDDGRRWLTIRTARDAGGCVRLTVEDSGSGIDAATAPRLFDAFYTTKDGGMGIGLFVSRSIIESHRGRMWAAPNETAGATFAISIPCDTSTWPDVHRSGQEGSADDGRHPRAERQL